MEYILNEEILELDNNIFVKKSSVNKIQFEIRNRSTEYLINLVISYDQNGAPFEPKTSLDQHKISRQDECLFKMHNNPYSDVTYSWEKINGQIVNVPHHVLNHEEETKTLYKNIRGAWDKGDWIARVHDDIKIMYYADNSLLGETKESFTATDEKETNFIDNKRAKISEKIKEEIKIFLSKKYSKKSITIVKD